MVLKVNGAIQVQYKAIELFSIDEKSKWPQQIAHFDSIFRFSLTLFWLF